VWVDISANPAHLQAFERTANDALALLYNPALTLAGKLNALRSDAAAQMFLPAGGVPYIHWDVSTSTASAGAWPRSRAMSAARSTRATSTTTA
jgi:hypothetical protein